MRWPKLELTVEFLLTLGGAERGIPENPQGRSQLEALIGTDKTIAMAAELQRRVPLPTRWLAQVMAWQGQSTAAIACRLRVSDTTVRGWLKGTKG